MRYLGLDWGTVRVGAAISDPEGKIAFPLKAPIASKSAIAEIEHICKEEGVESIVLGNPTSMQGNITESTTLTEAFKKKLETLGLPIELVDERLSSIAATRMLSEQGMKSKDQRESKDNVSAQIMLQAYLDNKNN